MKKLSTLFILFITISVFAQKNPIANEGFVIKGDIKNEIQFSLADILKYQPKKIDDVIISKYRDESGSNAIEFQGVLLKDLFTAMDYNTQNLQELSNLNITFKSKDGSKLMYSWKELFDSVNADKVFVITSQDGKKNSNARDGILLLTPPNLRKGPGYIKNLSEIVIQKVK